MTRPSNRRLIAVLTASAAVSIVAAPGTAAPARQNAAAMARAAKADPVYNELLKVYRSGAIDRAIDEFDALLKPREWEQQTAPYVRIDTWILRAELRKQRADLEAMLLLCTEAILRAWPPHSPYPIKGFTYSALLARLHGALRATRPPSPFLKAWYLLWESYRQLQVHVLWKGWPDYLDDALGVFPDDAQVLLAAGARQELAWWMLRENAARDPGRGRREGGDVLIAGRDYLRRSLAADAKEPEARLRLSHVLLELGALDEAATVLSTYEWRPDEPAFEYLARLFEGSVHERRGDVKGAVAAFDRAIALVAMPQSARIAKAHALHLDGQRSYAAETAIAALTGRKDQSDPWWFYLGGLAWRFEPYLKVARSMVIK